jgi:hypothetical protein
MEKNPLSLSLTEARLGFRVRLGLGFRVTVRVRVMVREKILSHYH